MKQLNALDLFTIGIGPSSSHTVGPMRAARLFALALEAENLLPQTTRLAIALYGSLGATGAGHGTNNALIAGLAGETPETCNPSKVLTAWPEALAAGHTSVLGHQVALAEQDLRFASLTRLPKHSNGMLFEAFDEAGAKLLARTYYSVGGGFVEGDEAPLMVDNDVPYAFSSAVELLAICAREDLTIA